MSIRKRGEAWEIVVSFQGKKHRRSAKWWTRAQARQVEENLRRELKDSAVGLGPVPTFNELTEKWLSDEVPHKRAGKSHKSVLRQIADILEGRPLTDVTEVVSEIRKAKGLNVATINRRLAVVRRLLSLAYREWGMLDQPLHQRVKLLPGETERHVYLTTAQVNRLVELCPRSGDAVLLAAYTGLRKGQIFALRKSHVDGDTIRIGAEGKTLRPMTIPIHPRIRHIVQGLPLKVLPGVLRKEFEAARVQIGMPDLRFHDLRHSFASRMIGEGGADLLHVRDLLGHSTVKVTQRYAHLLEKDLRKRVNKLK